MRCTRQTMPYFGRSEPRHEAGPHPLGRRYGGGGMDASESRVFWEEMARIKALPASTGMGLAMIGPTILEMGTEEQKHDTFPRS